MFIAAVEDMDVLSREPSATYAYYQSSIKPKPEKKAGKTVWRCTVCGYVYEGEELPGGLCLSAVQASGFGFRKGQRLTRFCKKICLLEFPGGEFFVIA